MFYSNVYSIYRSSDAIGEQLMNTLIISCCTLGIVFSIVSSITDISKFKKEFKLIFTAILITVLLKQVLSLDISYFKDISLEENPYSLEDYSNIQDYTYKSIQTEVETSITELLQQNDILCKNISVSINITDDSCISINRVTISTNDFEKSKQVIQQNFGNIPILEW